MPKVLFPAKIINGLTIFYREKNDGFPLDTRMWTE